MNQNELIYALEREVMNHHPMASPEDVTRRAIALFDTGAYTVIGGTLRPVMNMSALSDARRIEPRIVNGIADRLSRNLRDSGEDPAKTVAHNLLMKGIDPKILTSNDEGSIFDL